MCDLNPEFLFTKEELAKMLQLSERTVDRHIVEGKVPAPFYIGSRPRWMRSAIQEWFMAGCPGGGSKREMPQCGTVGGMLVPSEN
jgi:excisionase family DNA binding protein